MALSAVWPMPQRMLCSILIAFSIATVSTHARAHPHIFIDGSVDFVFQENSRLHALEVTWLYDEFETLYILSSSEMSLSDDGTLNEADRRELIRLRSDWPDDFDGSAHLTIDGVGVALDRPVNLDIRMVDGRLKMTFVRPLVMPTDLARRDVEVAFYEATYFFAFSVTGAPLLLGDAEGCSAQVTPFNPDNQSAALQTTLSKLSREETPDIAAVGALFADRITLRCE